MQSLTAQLLARAHEVQRELGREAAGDPDTPLAEMFDSMGLVEYLVVAAEALGVSASELEKSVGRRFTTVAELAASVTGIAAPAERQPAPGGNAVPEAPAGAITPCWLAAVAVRLPDLVQTAGELDGLLGRPAGWWQSHTGNTGRHVWGRQDPLEAAAAAACDCLRMAALTPADVQALLVVSEAPPLLAGLGAAVHARLGLARPVPVIEIGNACNGFLAALWVAQSLLARSDNVLIVCVEAASRLLPVQPGPAGAAAALFGDAAAACLVTRTPASTRLVDLQLITDGVKADLIRVTPKPDAECEVAMDGARLAAAAVEAMSACALRLLGRNRLSVADLDRVVMHAGNGRFPAILARELDIRAERVRSRTAETGNLGSASLPVAWALDGAPAGRTLWLAVGAGVSAGAALTVDDGSATQQA